MSKEIYLAMHKYIEDGKGDVVSGRLDNYRLPAEYKKEFIKLGLIK